MVALKKPYKKCGFFGPTPTLIRVKGFLTGDPGLHSAHAMKFQKKFCVPLISFLELEKTSPIVIRNGNTVCVLF